MKSTKSGNWVVNGWYETDTNKLKTEQAYGVSVTLEAGVLDPTKTTFECPLSTLSFAKVACTVQGKDQYGNPTYNSASTSPPFGFSHTTVASKAGASVLSTMSVVTQSGDGRYSLSFVAPISGHVNVTLEYDSVLIGASGML